MTATLRVTEQIELPHDLTADIEDEAQAVFRHDLTHDDESCFEIRRTFQSRWSEHVRPFRPHPRKPGRLRVGYFSSDFREWSGHWIFGPIVLGHSDAIETYTYSMFAPEWKPDAATRRYIAGTRWRDVSPLSVLEVARVIANDDLDILVDLMGFSFGLPHLVYAQRPARHIVTAWGHVTAGTQHPQIGHLFADPVACPRGTRSLYTERVHDLPNIVAYQPPALPAIQVDPNRPFTYGCFHRFEKITQRTLDCWAEILRRAPRAELVIKSWDFDRTRDSDRLLNTFGPTANRVQIHTATHWAEHMWDMNNIDVQLDTMPFTGGVVTMEALLMGVPTVTRTGRLVAARCGTSIMRAVGLGTWAVDSDAAYIDRAVRAYVEGTEPRERYRERLLDSPIGRIPEYIAAVEQRYQEIAA